MTSKFINLLAISSLAILACSFGPTPVNALSGESHNVVRHAARSHDHFVKKRKRGDKQRCRTRPPASSPSPAGSTGGNPAPAGDSGNNAGNNNAGNNSGNNNAGNNSGQPPQGNNAVAQGGSTSNFVGSGKKLGWAWASGPNDLKNFVVAPNTPIYNWGPTLTEGARELGFNPMPMLWGEKDIKAWSELVKPGYANVAMGFNEPNEDGQSNIPDARYGCSIWQQHIAPLRSQGYRLVSPAMSSRPNGHDWMRDFAAAGCDFDVLAVHWYDVRFEDFVTFVTKYHNDHGKPVWVTEYACQNFNDRSAQCSRDETFEFHRRVAEFANQTPWMEFVFPFGAMRQMVPDVNPDNQLMTSDGAPTALANNYIHG